MPFSSYRPHQTEKDEWQNNSVTSQVKRRNALFEQLRADQFDVRAAALAQLRSNLESWSRLAYAPENATTEPLAPPGHACKRQDSLADSGLFPLDNDDEPLGPGPAAETEDTNGQVPYASTSSLTLPFDIELPEPEQPPVPVSPGVEFSNVLYSDYSMYGPEARGDSPKLNRASLREALKVYLVLVLRASIDCPFADVRRSCRFILYRMAKLAVPVPAPVCDSPSWLIPLSQTIAYAHDKTSERPGSFSVASQSVKSSLGRNHVTFSSSFRSDDSDASQLGSAAPTVAETEHGYGNGSRQRSPSFAGTGAVSTSIDSQVFDSVDPIPISGRSSGKMHAPNASDIDNILLGPVEGRRARFSMDILSPSSLNRPALERKRNAAQTGFQGQRRASASLRQLHISCYQASGRITNLGRVLSYFPRFYETTIMLHDELIRKTGSPLQRVIKLYLCLMAAAEAKCQYFISYYTYKFLQHGEHVEWLERLDKVPRRVQKLATVNSILAHQPWKMTRAHVQDLLGRSKEAVHTSDQWTLSELCQALCILTVVHSQSRFALGCGIVPEPDCFGGACLTKQPAKREPAFETEAMQATTGMSLVPLFLTSPNSVRSGQSLSSMMALSLAMDTSRRPSAEGETQEDSLTSLLRKRRLSVGAGRHDPHAGEANGRPHTSAPREQRDRSGSSLEDFIRCGIEDLADESLLSTSAPAQHMSPRMQAAETPTSPKQSPTTRAPYPTAGDGSGRDPNTIPVNPILEDLSLYCRPEPGITDDTFDIQSEEFSVLDLADFNWEDHCCVLVGRMLPGLEGILEQTLTEALEAAGEMDEGFLFSDSHGPVDQRPLREAVWNFVLRLHGIHCDGYRYQDIPLLLNKSARRFLKKVCFQADEITRQDWATVGTGLTDQEKVLLTLLATHARLSASLLYAFRHFD